MVRGISNGISDAQVQMQPCGVGVSLKQLLRWTPPSSVDFENKFWVDAEAQSISFESSLARIYLAEGGYLVRLHEMVDVPLDIMGQVFVRSSPWRSGALLTAGVTERHFRGPVGGLL